MTKVACSKERDNNIFIIKMKNIAADHPFKIKVSFKKKMNSPGPEVIKLFSCSTQLSMKFQLLLKTKILKNKDFTCFKTLKLKPWTEPRSP